MNDVVRDVTGLASFAGARIELRLDLGPDLPVVEADRDLLARAIENLLRNAIEAMPGGGTVTVSTARAAVGVRVEVRDSGPGMDAVTRERALEGFFTTKASGSGMGLAFASRVARAHGGTLSVSSRPGQGTAVEIGLPGR